MFGLGWGEILLILAVALVLLDPEDLPRLLRGLGRMVGRFEDAWETLVRGSGPAPGAPERGHRRLPQPYPSLRRRRRRKEVMTHDRSK